jgi:hypothetical protein
VALETFRRLDPALLGCRAKTTSATLGEAMTTAELRRTRLTDEEVVAWRRDQLARAGCDASSALILAKRSHVDLHKAIELLECGCAPHLALEILL